MSRNHLRSPLARRLKGLHKRRRRRKQHLTYLAGERRWGSGARPPQHIPPLVGSVSYFCHYVTWNNPESFVLYGPWECRPSFILVLLFFFFLFEWLCDSQHLHSRSSPFLADIKKKKTLVRAYRSCKKKNIVWPLVPNRAFWLDERCFVKGWYRW